MDFIRYTEFIRYKHVRYNEFPLYNFVPGKSLQFPTSFLLTSSVLEPWNVEESGAADAASSTSNKCRNFLPESMEYFRKYCQQNNIPLSKQLEDTCVSNLLRHRSGQPLALHVALRTIFQHGVSTHKIGQLLLELE